MDQRGIGEHTSFFLAETFYGSAGTGEQTKYVSAGAGEKKERTKYGSAGTGEQNTSLAETFSQKGGKISLSLTL